MNYRINEKDKTPAYMQIYNQLRDDIINGVYAFGTKIPSKRLMATEIGVSVITIKHTLELLSEEGYLEPRERSGYFVAFKKENFLSTSIPAYSSMEMKKMPKANHIADVFPYTVLAKTMRKVILDYEKELLIKSPNPGCDYLRKEICAYLARSRSIHVEMEQVIIGSGAEYLYGLIAQFFDYGTEFAIEDPSYGKISEVYDAFRIRYDRLLLGPDGIGSEDLNNTRATVLHTTPFNSFPTGISITSSKKHEYLNWAKKRKGYIIEDNYDSELTVSSKPEDSLFSISDSDNVIYINTFSRTISPALRIGYMLLPKGMVKEYNRRLGFYSCTVPVFDQYVIAELLHSGDFERHINRERRKRRRFQETDN